MVFQQLPLILCLLSITKLAYGQSAGIVQLQPSEKAHFEVIFAQCCQNPSSCTRWRNTTGSTGSSNESVANLCALAGNVCNAEGFLQVLDASDLDMSCSFPVAEISQFTTLQFLNISNNENLTGSLDKLNTQYICFMAQNSLIELDMSFTGVDGSVPECLLANSELKTLALSNTLLSSLPDVFTTNSKLESLDLSNTALTGLLPASLSFASNLKLLNLRDNNLDGQIPEFSQKSIEFVDLSGNNLIGGVPHSLAAHPSLLSLDARDNQLTSLPIEWTASVYDISDQAPFPLEQILLSGNDLQDRFPIGLAAFPALKTLNLANNSLTGEIPSAQNNTSWFPSLQVLDISNNMFAGSEPAWISQVNDSDVTGNRFGTPVPPEENSPPTKPPSPPRPSSAGGGAAPSEISSDSESAEDNGLSGGAIAGIVIASLVLASVIAGGTFMYIRRRQDRNIHGTFDKFVEM
ncbi:hypothetical protein Ndes2526B_g06543 [Nannochloris sp. 'desiccata']